MGGLLGAGNAKGNGFVANCLKVNAVAIILGNQQQFAIGLLREGEFQCAHFGFIALAANFGRFNAMHHGVAQKLDGDVFEFCPLRIAQRIAFKTAYHKLRLFMRAFGDVGNKLFEVIRLHGGLMTRFLLGRVFRLHTAHLHIGCATDAPIISVEHVKQAIQVFQHHHQAQEVLPR